MLPVSDDDLMGMDCRVDLDIEGGSSSGYIAFVQELKSLFSGGKKK